MVRRLPELLPVYLPGPVAGAAEKDHVARPKRQVGGAVRAFERPQSRHMELLPVFVYQAVEHRERRRRGSNLVAHRVQYPTPRLSARCAVFRRPEREIYYGADLPGDAAYHRLL